MFTKSRMIAVVLLLCVPAVLAQPGLRTLSGTVTDPHHEPLKGAVVQVQDEVTGAVTSYLSERDGSYHFRRLSPQDDYKVWATYRGRKSKTREMSHFDSKAEKTLGLTVRLN